MKDNLFDPSVILSKKAWKKIGSGKRAGILVPLFSVYSKDSVGIGDLNDLKLLVDFCDKSGLSILQLLPMNEVGSTLCPYDAISSFAIEPAYISLADLVSSKDENMRKRIKELKVSFVSGQTHVDYSVRELKREILWDLFIKDSKACSASGFKKFEKETSFWLDDFALYKTLKSHHQGKAWYDWEDIYRERDEDALKDFLVSHAKEILFYKWAQWKLYEQFKAAKEYADSKGVFLKGDLPILISRDSADVWARREYFKLDFAAGAPPDMYCAKGQRWGMPTYDWENIASDDFIYLKKKLHYAENFYDILRVDHVVGLFRIWSIRQDDPYENEGLNGSFDPKDEAEWSEHGRTILQTMINDTNMLLCAEDLGIIPKACPEVLKEYGIPGNDVQRWVKDWQKRHDFLPPDEYRAMAVAMLSTHDTTNWAAWWENEAGTVDEALFMRKCKERGFDYDSIKDRLFDFKRSKHGRLRWLDELDSKEGYVSILGRREEEIIDFIDMYVNTFGEKNKLWKYLGLKGPMREKCDSDIIRAVFKIVLSSNAIFCIDLIIDYLYLADVYKTDAYNIRINRPGTVNKMNWSLIIRLSLEELLKHKVCKEIKQLVKSSGRA